MSGKSICHLLGSLAVTILLTSTTRAVVIQTVPVGSPGNAPDPVTSLGAVPYSYNIGKYDVTNSQYAEFLNTTDPSGANLLDLWNSKMGAAPFGGISFNAGNADGSKYTLIPGAQNRPIVFVTWYDAIRFANWLNNGQGNGNTETGAYTLGALDSLGVPINGISITRNAGATVFLPNDSEWYKAACYDPTTGSYFQYSTSSNTVPTAEAPPGGSNSANYFGAAVNGPTDVGAYTGTTSPCGAFDMAGNVWNWNEALYGDSAREWRGGCFGSFAIVLLSGFDGGGDPALDGGGVVGFRVASVPEPSTGILALLACGLMSWKRKSLMRIA